MSLISNISIVRLYLPLKFIFLIVLIFFINQDKLQAQDSYNRFGIKLGINRMVFSPLESNETGTSQIGFQAGIFGRFRLPVLETYAQTTLLYTRKGAKYQNTTGVNHHRSLTQIEIPIVVGVYLFEKKFNIYAGPSIGFVINSEEEISFRNISTSSKIQGLNNTLLGYRFGFGYRWSKFEIDLHYESTFNSTTQESQQYKLRGFSINLAYLIY